MNPVEEFLQIKEAHDKEAGFFGNLANAFKGSAGASAGHTMGHALREGLAGAAVSAGVAAVGYGATKGVGALKERFGKQRDYQGMMSANPTLKKMPAKQVQMVYNSLRTMSPSMAKDPLIAGSFVRRTMELSPDSGPAIDLQSAKMLAETQRNLSQAKKSRGPIAEQLMPGFKPTYPREPTPDKPMPGFREERYDMPMAGRDDRKQVTVRKYL